ncbi:class I SAM-dependent methyltransferase [Hoeflea sp. TYP-13]|uniref:class I SAM-dependent methyltransferase n=1 Tax=Hoeflea sp. TYP-13 TaxID=3230023 RepID=UPI0034C6377F
MRNPSRFWDRMAEGYSKKPVANEAAYQKKLEVTRNYFRPDMEVMEFGCGTGSTAIAHAPHVKHILATDFSSKMIGIARAKAEKAGIGNVTFSQTAIDDFTAADQTFDVVMGHSILHLVEDKEAVIAKVHKMLKPGGLFVSNTVCLGTKLWFFKYIGPIGKFFGLLPTIKVFKVEDLIDSLTRAGFAIDYQWTPDKGMSVFVVAKKAR